MSLPKPGPADSRERFTNTLSYLATCLSMLCGGTTSLFATYGSSFGEILGFTQYETNLVASLGDYAHYMSAPLFGYLSSRIGPRQVIQAAGVLMFLGYLGLGYAFSHFDTPSQRANHYVASMSLLFALVGVGSKAAYMSSMATTARNFKHSRISGIALGIPISLYGLSTFVFSSLKARWFEADPTPSRYLTFMAVVSLIANVTAAHFVVVKEDPAMAIRRRAASLNRANRERAQSEAIEMVETRRRRALTAGNEQGLASSTSTLVDDDVIEKRPTGESQPAPPQLAVPAAVQSDEPVFRRFTRDPLAWSLLLGMICFSGPGMAFVNNCGSMVRALSINTSLTPEQIGQYKDNIVATQSFFSFSSRLAIGYLSDIWRTRLRLPRAGLLILGGLLQVYAQSVAMRVAKLDDLYSLAIVTGISMGSVFTLAPTITSETWGAENFGICWGFITLGPAIGGHICNLIFGASWDRGYAEIVRRLGPDAAQDLLQCDRSCFVPAFMSTIRYAYMGVFFFCVVLCLPRIQAIWKRN